MEIENNFNVDGKLEVNSNIYYKYDNLQKAIIVYSMNIEYLMIKIIYFIRRF